MRNSEPWACAVTCHSLEEADHAIAQLNSAEIPVGIETCANSGPDDRTSVESSPHPFAIVVPMGRVAQARHVLSVLRHGAA